MRLLVIDDHPLFVEGFAAMVGRLRPGWRLETAPTGDAALLAMQTWLPDAVVTDVFLPGKDGFDIAALVRDRWPAMPIILMSGRDHATMAARARRSPANGFLAKSMLGTEFVELIEAIIAGESVFSDIGPAIDIPRLTSRQAEVLDLLAAGHGNKEIRYRLGIAERTVRAHLTELFQILGVHGRMTAVIKARALGLIE